MSLVELFPFLVSNKRSALQIESSKWEERNRILDEQVNLFRWKREEKSGISSYLEKCLEANVESISFHTTAAELPINLDKVKTSWPISAGPSEDEFWRDVYQVAYDFLQFSHIQSGTIHLKVIENDACRKFHTDLNTLRLFVTYLGKGTEWLPEKATNRKELGKRNALIVKDPDLIQQIKPFDVGILKGEAYSSKSGIGGIVHRSPEIEKNAEKRIILRIDI